MAVQCHNMPLREMLHLYFTAVRGPGIAYRSRAPDFTSGFHTGSCPVICVSLFHVSVLSFGF